MEYLNGIPDVANPAFIILPVLLMVLSGFAIGVIISKIRKTNATILGELIYGNIILIFLFICGFIIFGVLTYATKIYFEIFTFILMYLAALGFYFMIRQILQNKKNIPIIINRSTVFILFAVALFSVLIVYQGIVIYYHPIFEEYDAIYNYLLTSKSILLDNGLHHDYYRGSDVSLKSPPLDNAINAWIIDAFGYSSLRLFPIYFILLSALFVYRFSKRLTKNSFLGWIASAVFLITPSTLVISSRFSLANDIGFILFLTSTFYFFVVVISQKKIARFDMLMLVISLSVVSLSKELGILISFAIIFLVISAKFTQGNLKLRILFNFLSVLPFYVLVFYDFHNYGLMPLTIIRFVTTLLANVGLYYLLSKIKSEENFSSLIRNLGCFTPFMIPIIFLGINVVTIHGPYPILTFSESAAQSMDSFRSIFGFENKNLIDLPHALEKIPRIDILFSATALGTLFIFFKLRGFVTLLLEFKNNYQYCGVLVVFVLLLVIWAYFDLGFESSNIRHIGEFASIFAVIIVLSMKRTEDHYKIFYYGLVVFFAYYLLFNNIQIVNGNDHFEGFWIDQYKDPIITQFDIELAAVLILSLLLIELKENKIIKLINKTNLQRFFIAKQSVVVVILFVLLGLNAYTLSATGVSLQPLKTIDENPLGKWENDVFDVINYLNQADAGNVISLQAPAISFFTNKTNFELLDPHVFALFSPILQTDNATLFKEKISEINVKYFVLPNEKSTLYDETKKIRENFNAIKIIENDNDFLKIDLKTYTIYKFVGSSGINLIDDNHEWFPFYYAKVNHNNQTLSISVKTNDPNEIDNRAFLETTLVSHPAVLTLEYTSQSMSGNAIFYVEIDDKMTGKAIWSSILDNTEGTLSTRTFLLPDNVSGKPIMIKMFIITEGPGEHLLTISEARIVHT